MTLLKTLSKQDWDSLLVTVLKSVDNGRIKYTESYESLLHIKSKVSIKRRAPTFGNNAQYERTHDLLKKLFNIPFTDLPKYSEPPKNLNSELWRILYLWRLQSGL